MKPGPGFSVATNLFSFSAYSPSSPATHTSRTSNTNTHLRLTRVIEAPPPELIARQGTPAAEPGQETSNEATGSDWTRRQRKSQKLERREASSRPTQAKAYPSVPGGWRTIWPLSGPAPVRHNPACLRGG